MASINNFTDTTASKLYAQSLGYMKNGNIANMNWRNTILNDEGHFLPGINREYGFTYDGLNRLSNALYEHTEDGTGTIVQDLFTTAYSYDLNGNVTGLKRWGNTAMGGESVVAGLIDDMFYTYFDNSNQIKSVADNTTSFVGHNLHFTEGPGDFAYDHNGSATYLPHKGAAIGYNYLALPESIDITGEGVIGYTYSATGVKLVKSFGAAKTYYQGNAENMAGTEVLYHPEGRAVKTAGGWGYEYNLTDHLGNTRASFAIDTVHPVILQQKNYYPFGLEQATWNDMDANATRRLFGGKELQDEGELMTYDFGWRQLDVETNRWYVVDPSAEWGFALSPYNYTNNNPVRYVDPDGRWFWERRHIRKARQLRRRTKGSLHIWKKNGKKYASVSYGTKGTKRSGAGSITQVFRPTTKSRKTQTQAGGYTVTGNSFFSGGDFTGDGYRADHNYGMFDGSYTPPHAPFFWALQWIVNKARPLINKEPEIGKPKITSDKEIMEKHGGSQKRTDAQGVEYGTGKYRNWKKTKSAVGSSYEDSTGDSVLYIDHKGDSTLYIDITKSEGSGYNWRVVKPLSNKR